MPKQITIPAGATLSGLAKQNGVSVSDLMALNPTIKDPSRIFAGASLTVPDMTGTLPSATPAAPVTVANDPSVPATKTLPTVSEKQTYLQGFRDTLRLAAETAAEEARASGMKALPAGMDNPSKMSGNGFADVVNFVNSRKTAGIADIYSSTTQLLDNAQKAAADKLNTLISTGSIANLDDNTLSKLSAMSDYSLEDLQGLRKTALGQIKKDTVVTEKNGRNVLMDSQTGEVISDLGAVKVASSGGGGGSTATERAAAAKQTRLQSISKQLQDHIGADTFVDTAVYSSLMLQNPDLADLFPAERPLNPNDPTATRFFPKSESKSRAKK
jgi:murein DD-endopeptidase MepM/ murein hydrolase activator NlpD